MDNAKDFDGDLAELKANLDVTDVLKALKESQTSAANKPPTAARSWSQPDHRPQRNQTTKTVPESPRRTLQKADSQTNSAFINVTTKLTRETKDRLRQAALLQAAHGREPATEYSIINQALEDWLKRHGYGRRCKEAEQAPGEAPT